MWSLNEWNSYYNKTGLLMSEKEIEEAIKYLRGKNPTNKPYPKPEDCAEQECPKYRPACKLGICNIAVGMCGDF